MKKIKFSVYAKSVRGGMVGIYIRCQQGVRIVPIDTGVRVFSDEWDEDNGLIVNNPNSLELNRTVRKCVYDLQNMEYSKSEEGISLSSLIKIWNEKDSYHDFYLFFENHISTDNIRDSTSKLHKNTLAMLKCYKKKCLLCDLDEDYVEGFYLFLRNHTFLNDRRYESTTIKKHLKILRTYYNKAKKIYPRHVNDIDFSKIQIKTSEKPIKSLEENDIKILEKIVNCEKKENDELVVYQFLFMSYTGCRYSDFVSLNESNLIKDRETLWLNYTSIKTGVPVKIPLNLLFDGRAEQILYRYKDRLKHFFSIPSNSTWNKKIQRIAKKYGVIKHISAHIARHTFATRLLARNIPLTTIQKVIGHRKPETTMIYAKVSDNMLLTQFSKK
ncbi:site-specific integrase [Bacteroides mediterraneensis]|uniref:site-specific integrase n=1 Tax=Bacteroides mediterraneensis TaxID=1841856 RepID=UPI000932F69C|nr:site-specific integrase [Bacteroides mediterraneensis]